MNLTYIKNGYTCTHLFKFKDFYCVNVYFSYCAENKSRIPKKIIQSFQYFAFLKYLLLKSLFRNTFTKSKPKFPHSLPVRLAVLFFLITDFIALIAVNNLLDIQLLPSIPSC